VVRDERTVVVENAGYKWAAHFLVVALFIDMMCRYLVWGEAAWDLMALVFMAGVVCTAYQARQKALPRGWVKTAALIGLLGGVIGGIAVGILLWLRSQITL
jgi:hypothetical protein